MEDGAAGAALVEAAVAGAALGALAAWVVVFLVGDLRLDMVHENRDLRGHKLGSVQRRKRTAGLEAVCANRGVKERDDRDEVGVGFGPVWEKTGEQYRELVQ